MPRAHVRGDRQTQMNPPLGRNQRLLIALAASFLPLLAQTAEKPKRSLLFIGQAKGYQHEAISTAMVTLYDLGRSTGLWNTQLRTDCAAITKKPLKWEAKNLDAFDAIVFF